MRKLLLAMTLVLNGVCFAAEQPIMAPVRLPIGGGLGTKTFPTPYNNKDIMGPYISSVTCIANITPGQEVRISTVPAILHTVIISSGGILNANVEFFDSYFSTGNSGANQSTNAPYVRSLTGKLNTMAGSGPGFAPPFYSAFDVMASSGITMNNFTASGGTPACVTVTWTPLRD